MAKGSSGYQVVASPIRAAVANNRAQQSNGKRASGGIKFAPSARSVSAFRERLVSQFGKALGASIYRQTDVYAATAGAGRAMVRAGTQQLAGNAAAMADVQTIFKQGQAAQSAAFAYAKALQLKEQTAASDDQVAQFAAQMMMAEQQHQWAMEEATHQAELAAGSAEGTGTSPTTAKALATEAGGIGTDISTFVNAVNRGDYEEQYGLTAESNAVDVAKVWASTSLYGSDPDRSALARNMIQAMVGKGLRATAAFSEAARVTYSGMPGADKWLPKAIKGAQADMHASFARAFTSNGPEGFTWDQDKRAWVSNDTGATLDADTDPNAIVPAFGTEGSFTRQPDGTFIGPGGGRYELTPAGKAGAYYVPV